MAHAYQGMAGRVRSTALGAALMAIVLLTHSIWPAVVLHSVLAWKGGQTGWLILRDPAESARENGGMGAPVAELQLLQDEEWLLPGNAAGSRLPAKNRRS